MKRLLLAIIFCLFVSSMANAQCAWVLWERSEFAGRESINDSYTGWHIVGAFPTVNACLQDEENICTRRQELDSEDQPNQNPLFKPKNVKCFKSWGGHTETWNNERGFHISEWKCLPDTIDPRK